MPRRVTVTPRLPLHTTHALTRHKVRIGALHSTKTHRLVHVKSNAITRSRRHHLLKMSNDIFRMMVQSIRDNAGMPRLYIIDTKSFTKSERTIKPRLVVQNIASRLMMHYQPDILLPRIISNPLDIIIIGRSDEVGVTPFCPAFVPALHKHATNIMFRCKIDIPHRLLRRCSMPLALRPFGDTKMIFPPYPHVCHWFPAICTFRMRRSKA